MEYSGKFGIHFKMRAERAKDGRAPVFMGIVIDAEKIYIALKGFVVDIDHWDKLNGSGKKSTKQGRDINKYLEDVRWTMKDHYRKLELTDAAITAEKLKCAFLGLKEEQNTPMLSELVKYHNDQASTLLSKGTMSHYFVTQRYINKFIKQTYHQDDFKLSELNYKFIADFELFLYNHRPKDHQKKMDTNGVLKHLIRLKKMVNLGSSLRWVDGEPFKGFKMRKKAVDKEFLNEWELQRVEEKEFEIERLNTVRDMFIFSCYTGLAFIDMVGLTPENIVTGLDGEPWLRTFRQKTLVPVNTPLLPKALALIKKYKSNYRAQVSGKVFPLISNQKMNAYLKEIAKICGVSKNMTYHVARHTFATTVTLSNGVPIETVSKILGHTKISTTQIYARVLERKISEDMSILKRKLEKS
ncbi:site-specific integrase [Mucilaginibacter achroorhodeus]|uniref:Site-specific integrase n=2 Tax=Mucilaginibacter achroorhodeus TaxID=2599294 RepID=A0A563U036_9SPHI|nr:site-specific integrase [Mucilaginibacter achroorhodeus]